ncbi:hypothetical protein C2845_PM02G26560 [Panicum miliaceum]|uniref:F-box protein AT5G49610-like beta-propeller domain-containing protein n=1 Tax=Panicum miliaceum TaxID=4540 RepID=A0A3L6SDD7_PANMI|nr:hypothetical protein C2845_PM02G26560 [Panicum miliaceum]
MPPATGIRSTKRSSMPPPAVPDDLIEEILLRFPPRKSPSSSSAPPSSASVGSASSPIPASAAGFGSSTARPRCWGFFCTERGRWTSRFVPTSSVPLPHAIRGNWRAVDARHSRVLISTSRSSGNDLVVWDPVTGEQHRLPKLPEHMYPPQYLLGFYWTAAVLCAAVEGGCDHFDCHRSPFLVVFVCTGPTGAFAYVYSSETGEWSGPASAQLRSARVHLNVPSALVGNALHFMSGKWGRTKKILKYVLGTQEISPIHLPHKPYNRRALMTMADGSLGFAAVDGSKLCLWSMVSGTNASWAQSHTIDLKTIGTLPGLVTIVCCMDGMAAILMGINDREFFVVDLKSRQIRKIPKGRFAYPVVLYMSFYTPGTDLLSFGFANIQN